MLYIYNLYNIINRFFFLVFQVFGASQVILVVKNLPTNVGDLEMSSLGQEDPLEEEMATCSSILAWEIPLTEEVGDLQSMGLQRVRHDWVTDHIHI